MAHTITIDAAQAGLQQFCNRFGTQFHQTLKQSLELEGVLPFQPCEYAYTGTDAEINDVLQPYQKAFTPVNTETFGGITNYLQPGKIDLLFDEGELQDFFTRWRCEWFQAGLNPLEWSYPRFVMENLVLPKFQDNLNYVSYNGVYAAPTPGTAGAYTTSFTGFKSGVAALVTAGDLTPIATGAPLAGSMHDQVREFCAGIPEPYRYKAKIIFMSKTNAQLYSDNFKSLNQFRTANLNAPDKLHLMVDDYNATIIGVTAMEGSNRFIATFPGLRSLIIGEREGYSRYPNFRFQVFDRTLKAYSEIYRFYGFETVKHLFVNDQA